VVIFLLFLSLMLVITSLVLVFGLHKAVIPPPPTPVSTELVTVIVAARNEEARLAPLIGSVLAQSHQNFQLIIALNLCTDNSKSVVLSFDDPRIRLLQIADVPEGFSPKKFALSKAVALASSDILLFTDADCLPPVDWIEVILNFFNNGNKIVIGFSPFRAETGWLNAFQRYECLRTAMLTAAAVGLDKAYMSVGRNLAYRKSVFDDVKGFDDIMTVTSGDDDLFIQLVQRKTSHRIAYAASPPAFVPTDAQPTWEKFVNQKSRHFSAGAKYSGTVQMTLAVWHLLNLLGLVVLPLKLVLDFCMLHFATRALGERDLLKRFWILEIGYTLYAVFFPLLAFKKFTWKR
jgi:cellulose synthase/poly-beta-1,6-N-acetylglucosamine synthase-like glycosyltransferase